MIRSGREPGSPARAAFVALPLTVLAAFLFRAESFGTSMGPDELSLFIMAWAMVDGIFPYDVYWDVRAPLAYLIALPSALLTDAFAGLAVLRLLTVLVHAGAAWTFFCLFRRSLGIPGTVIGVLVLLITANMVELHHLAMPNHFVMGMSLVAFACLVAGLRGRRGCFLLSALLAGALPWVMVQSGLVTLGLTALVLLESSLLRRRERATWVAIAACPSVVIVGVFFFFGPFGTFIRTIFLAPLGVVEEGMGGSWTISNRPGPVPWLGVYVFATMIGALQFPGLVRRAPLGSPIRYASFLVVPSVVGLGLMSFTRILPPLDYVIEAAPAAALFAAVAASRLWNWAGWASLGTFVRTCPTVLRMAAAACLGVAISFPIGPWDQKTVSGVPKTPLPVAYCDSAAHWATRLRPRQTILDLAGICGLKLLETGKAFEPPFTYAGNWFRPGTRWIGRALSGDGSEANAVTRLRTALSDKSNAGVIVANRWLLEEVERRGWQSFFHSQWRLVWHRHVPGHEEWGFDQLAVFVRSDMHMTRADGDES